MQVGGRRLIIVMEALLAQRVTKMVRVTVNMVASTDLLQIINILQHHHHHRKRWRRYRITNRMSHSVDILSHHRLTYPDMNHAMKQEDNQMICTHNTTQLNHLKINIRIRLQKIGWHQRTHIKSTQSPA